MIAALYVAKNGPYFDLPGVDPYDQERDARTYAGPHSVVAHPPCERWGRYWSGGPSARERRMKGDDGGCFDRALWAVRNFGGVLEHPAFSAAWSYYRLCQPDAAGGWLPAGDGFGAWVCHVHQGHYGHPADKATWLYAVAPRPLPELVWGPAVGKRRLEDGFHSTEERARARCREDASSQDLGRGADPYAGRLSRGARSDRRAREAGLRALEVLSRRARAHTPAPFRDTLIELARRAHG